MPEENEFEGMAEAFVRRAQKAQDAVDDILASHQDPRDEAQRLREELDDIKSQINRLPMEQCEAEGHSYNVVSAYETHEPLVLNCLVCGGVWDIGPRKVKTMDSAVGDGQ